MKMCVRIMTLVIIILLVPHLADAQGMVNRIRSLNDVLDTLYDDMMPLCSRLIGVGRGIAGFAATWYIAAKVWGHIARAEPIDFYPLFRPFVLGFAVLIFPSVIAMINGVMKPTVTATAAMVKDSDKTVAQLLKMKEEAIKTTAYWQMYVGPSGSGDRDKWYKYNYGDKHEGWLKSIGNDIRFAFAKFSYNFRNSIKEWMSEVLKVLFEAAALCINTIRTFYLIVLGILGPLVFGIAVFDGFQHTLTVWIDTFFSTTDTAYLIFMISGIIGYFTVPSVANYIIHAGGGNTLLYKVTNMMSTSARTVAGGGTSMVKDVYGDMAGKVQNSFANQGLSGGYFNDKSSGGYMRDKLSGGK